MGNFKKVIKLLKKKEELDEKLKTKIKKFNKIYKYSIELLLTTIVSNNLENELNEKKDEFSSNVYDNQNLRVLLEILNEKGITINDILHNLAGLEVIKGFGSLTSNNLEKIYSRTEDEEAGFGFGSLPSNNLTLGRKRKSTKTRGRKKKETTKKSSSNKSNSNRTNNRLNLRYASPPGESPTSLGNKKQRKRNSSRKRKIAKKNM